VLGEDHEVGIHATSRSDGIEIVRCSSTGMGRPHGCLCHSSARDLNAVVTPRSALRAAPGARRRDGP
jgi:hypothetical protein